MAPMDKNSGGGRNPARPPIPHLAETADGSLFLVERRVPAIAERELAMLQAALTEASQRFTARGEHVCYLRSIFLARQDRLLEIWREVDTPRTTQGEYDDTAQL